jgi:hypothetical protein
MLHASCIWWSHFYSYQASNSLAAEPEISKTTKHLLIAHTCDNALQCYPSRHQGKTHSIGFLTDGKLDLFKLKALLKVTKIWAIRSSTWNKISSIKVYETINICHIWTYFSVLALGLLPPAAILWAMRRRFCCKVSSSISPLEDGSSTFGVSTFFPIMCKGTHGENNLTHV